jgi:hypothetical protein
MNELNRLIEGIKQQTAGMAPGFRFLEFRAGTEADDVTAIGFIDRDGGIHIMAPDQMIEAAGKAKRMIREAIDTAANRKTPYLEFPQPPVTLAFEILFGEIARLRMDAAKDKAERNSTG